MSILFDSDKVGIALGLVVFLAMILVGLHGSVPPSVVIARALVGFTVTYVLGFTLSRWITSALIAALAAERARRFVERKRKKQEGNEQESTEAEPGSETT